ncbi:unnamed protein product [Mytilus coruscus]|uniref:Mitochondria-eating protein C-terminal domain-containing protein n=1 Tax=Mytilus coruscus TaxID=42192 RepID=A0A6J8A5W2_MYTCO|nr:unnamed protein product [Mytilus coruscus]
MGRTDNIPVQQQGGGEQLKTEFRLKSDEAHYKLCEEKSSVTLKAGQEILQYAVSALMIESSKYEIMKQAMDIRKLSTETTSEQLLEIIFKNKKETIAKYFKNMDKEIFEMIMSTPFFAKCIKLCWEMVVQDPPMVLHESLLKDKTFDREVFKEYNMHGSKVVCMVWPALYVHKNGTLLMKGVVKVK